MAQQGKKRITREDVMSDVRALLSRVRAKGFKVDDRKRAFIYRTGLQKVLLDARLSYTKASPKGFFEALDKMTFLETTRFARQPVGHDFLLQFLTAEPLPLNIEVLWVSSRLQHEQAVINEHIRYASEIEQLFLRGDASKALQKLNEYEDKLGISLWATELRIALAQTSQGLDAQKSVLNDVRAVRRKGMWHYITNTASVRAEPSVSIGWFIEENRRRLERQKNSPYTDYLRYRSIGVWPETNAGCSKVLRVEQNHHVVDIYETFIAFLQEVSTRSCSSELEKATQQALENLKLIEDTRVRKLEFKVKGVLSIDVPIQDLELTDLLFTAAPTKRIQHTIRKNYRSHLTVESIISLALAVAKDGLSKGESSSLKLLAVRGLAKAFQRVGYQAAIGERPDEELTKLAHVYSATPFGRAMVSLLRAASSPRTDEALKRLQISALNSPAWGILDLIGFASHPQHELLTSLFPSKGTKWFADLLANSDQDKNEILLRPDLVSLGRSLHKIISGMPQRAAEIASVAISSTSRVIAAHAAVLALNCYARTGAIYEASKLIAREHVEYGVDPESMPVREIYEGIEWRDMKAAASAPELSIALSLIQSTEGDDRLRTYRRFALETLLKSVGKDRPSALRSTVTDWPTHYMIFFMEHVCTSAMLDMLPSIKSSRSVLEERRDIFGYLAILDKVRSDYHTHEVLEISREITVLDGLRTIDGSRVHVDKESLTRRLKVDLAESFQRYSSLSRTNEATTDGVATIVRDMSKEQQPDYLLSMPTSEMDEILVSMFLRARDQFMFNIPHGLDSYISKRIRHGSIVGVIRAPAEREGVAARRNLDGSYRTEGILADSVADTHQRAALVSAIANTSKAIDQHLLKLKDTLLHVKSELKPHGLFSITLTPPMYLVIRSFASSDASLDSFIETLLKSLWAMLTPSLAQAQILLKRDSVAFVSDQFHSLRVRAQKILTNAEERAAFDAAAVRASVGMQAALQTAASWFEPAESNPRSYTLDEVIAIALESVRATTTSFVPDLEIISNFEFSFSELTLPLVCDVLYIALGNVAAHTKAKFDPKVRLEVNSSEAENSIVFRVRNELGYYRDEELTILQQKLELIRNELVASKGKAKARVEGGSGLHKLATIVDQGGRDSMEFACVDGYFELTVTLPYSRDRPF
ncbi:MAG: hypothetical protein E6Q50_11575 [Lysobacter sp.]|nr:MAG: hypothetical protein E6Q50_11575 [Lysobacter sp.]